MTYTISITDAQIFTAMKAWIAQALTAQAVQGIVNRVAMPKGGFVEMTGLLKEGLTAYNLTSYTQQNDPTPGTEINQQSIDYHIQLDCYGKDSADWAQILNTSFSSDRAIEFFRSNYPGIAPLHVEDPKQAPLVTGEQQYEKRWTMVAHLQYKPAITDTQESALEAVPGVINVDAAYHG